jgi:hypothetical protein
VTIVEVEPEVGEDDLWVVHEDPQPSDAMVQVDFDELLESLDKDHIDDEVPVEVVGVSENDEPDDERFVDEVVDWVLNALGNRKLEVLDIDSVQEEAAVDGDEEEVVDDEVPVDVEGTFEDHESDDQELVVDDRELLDEGAKILDENPYENGSGILDTREGWRLAQRLLRYPDGREPPATILEMVSRTGAAVVSVELVLDGERWLLTRQV